MKPVVALVCLLAVLPAHSQKLTLSPAAPSVPASLAARTQDLSSLFAEIWQDRLSQSPISASLSGDARYDAQLPGLSVSAYNQQLARDAQYLARLAAIDTAGMSAQEVLSRDLMLLQLTQSQEASQFNPWQMPVTQVTGLPATLPLIARRLPFASSQNYDDYSARLAKVPAAFQQLTDNAMAGISAHRVPPAFVLQDLLAQINAILALKPADSPFAEPLQRFPSSIPFADQPALRQEVLAAIATQVYPAYKRFAHFLQAVYIPAGRNQPGLWTLPGGPAYYAFLVQQATTTAFTPDQLHQFGLAWVATDEASELALAKKLGYPTLPALRSAMASDSSLHPVTAAQLLAAYTATLRKIRPRLPQLVADMPHFSLSIQPVPAWRESDAPPAQFESGAPAILWINTSDLPHRSLADVPTLACAQGIPGRALQSAVAAQIPSLPQFRRHLQIPAYAQGWALYAGQLAQEAGLFQDPYAEAARLEIDTLASVRVVVDTGIHAGRWTRQQAIDYYRAHTGLSDAAISAEVDRIAAQPAAALAAKTGEMEILALRAAAQKTLGPRFSLAAFNSRILAAGPLPLDMLSTRVIRWMNTLESLPAKRYPLTRTP